MAERQGRKQYHNTMVRKCKTHGETIFSINNGGRSWRCLKCGNDDAKRRKSTLKERAVAVLGGKCQICDYDTYIGALEFHHIEPKFKSFELSSGNLSKPWATVLAEIEKCALLCANCHREIHAGIALLTDRRENDGTN